jgi:trk system potassium uptake protein
MEQKPFDRSKYQAEIPYRKRLSPWHVPLPRLPGRSNSGPSPFFIVLGFAALIILGAFLLILPVSSQTRMATSIVDALFTATSAACVTGLVVYDTASHWSFFGQAVILALIQIGGFGFMTSATLLLLLLGHRIGLRDRLLISEAMGLGRLGGLLKIVIWMAIFVLASELLGAVIFFTRFIPGDTLGLAIWKSIFHAVSAFNNAGFDIFGGFQSLAAYRNDPVTVLTTAVLIFLGSISFMVIIDFVMHRDWQHLSLNSKLVLSVTGTLLVLGTVLILLTEYTNPATLGQNSFFEKLLHAFFQTISRTAGFSTITIGLAGGYTLFFIMLLMFIGGATGSTAGGIKVNTFGMLMSIIWSALRGREHAVAFGREFTVLQMRRALTLVFFSSLCIAMVTLILTLTERFDFLSLIFESVSAFGTVGYSTGITPALSTAGKLVITAAIFLGRLGPLSLILILNQRQQRTELRYPREIIRIG